MDRLRTAAWAALPLLLPFLAAGPASAAQSTPSLTYGSVRSVRPGDTLTVEARSGEAAYGDTLRSAAFVATGTLRMRDPLLTTTVTIACDARSGTYPVLRRGAGDVGPDEHPFRWARVRVGPADEAARRACRDKVKKLPAPDPEERWAPGDTWPQSPWDVRTFRAGSRITITDNDDEGADGQIRLSSRAFTERPVLRGAKAVLTATATLTCDAAPGRYVVYRHEPGQKGPDRPWARLRIAPAARGSACSTQAVAHSSGTSGTAWTAGGAVLAAAAGATVFLRARSRRANPA
ncbi:hypothetical protein SRB17_69880 [Streptomyces sp. RB17]|uniref:hypothetical protein n=1 Tax=Streptomyces sp. RB17 TaxID=2585197 RepID=UPI001295EBE4|nr:hypothetical protein [Streptomyces sp. RB17]MQY38973.1 hypothetical protein [Streptomyces sp. RB17]